jgi:hypothetical protein
VQAYLDVKPIGEVMAKSAREILNGATDIVANFNENVAGYNTRDITGRPLGDILGHSVARLKYCYEILEAAQLAAASARMRLKTDDKSLRFGAHGAASQDKTHTRERPAAHRAPCSLEITSSALLKPGTMMQNAYVDGINRSYVLRLFSETSIVHVIANRADWRCEGFSRSDRVGFVPMLVDCCNMVASGGLNAPRQVFYDVLVPGFRNAASKRLVEAQQELVQGYPNDEGISPLLDARGELYFKPDQPSDNRLRSTNKEARKLNLQALVQVLEIYSATPEPKQADIKRVAGNFEALWRNENSHAREYK